MSRRLHCSRRVRATATRPCGASRPEHGAGEPRARIRSSGYVMHTLEAALWSVEQTDSFEEAVVLAVNLGDDADTVGAVTGQLAGALYGASAIPERWLANLSWRPRILTMADALA